MPLIFLLAPLGSTIVKLIILSKTEGVVPPRAEADSSEPAVANDRSAMFLPVRPAAAGEQDICFASRLQAKRSAIVFNPFLEIFLGSLYVIGENSLATVILLLTVKRQALTASRIPQ
jgi:hypothetical protein